MEAITIGPVGDNDWNKLMNLLDRGQTVEQARVLKAAMDLGKRQNIFEKTNVSLDIDRIKLHRLGQDTPGLHDFNVDANPQISDHIRNRAIRDQRIKLSSNWVWVYDNKVILAYASLAMCSIEKRALNNKIRDELEIRSIPAIWHKQSAVHKDYVGQGIGTAIGLWALNIGREYSSMIGCRLMACHTTPESYAYDTKKLQYEPVGLEDTRDILIFDLLPRRGDTQSISASNSREAGRKKCAIIQARTGSSRFPKKIFKEIGGRTMLHHVIMQTLAARSVDCVIVATTTREEDGEIVDYCRENSIEFFRGSQDDLLDRYYQCAKKFGCDTIIRITSDCPMIDPGVIDRAFEKFGTGSHDFVANNIEYVGGKWIVSKCNFPQGMTVEISSFNALEKAWKEAKIPSEREHVFPYIPNNPDLFRISNLVLDKDLSHIRCTVDHKEDLRFVQELFERIDGNKVITIRDIENVVEKEPRLTEMNGNIQFDEGWNKSLLEDKKGGF